MRVHSGENQKTNHIDLITRLKTSAVAHKVVAHQVWAFFPVAWGLGSTPTSSNQGQPASDMNKVLVL